MADRSRERPCIHVCLTGGADPALYRWVEIGAEEEGVPCRQVQLSADGPVATAYATAQSSRFDIGVAVTPERVILHEAHMPPEQPVLTFSIKESGPHICRLMGSNAARLVIRLPFRFDDETDQPFEPPARQTAQSGPLPAPTRRPTPPVAQNPGNPPAGANPGQADITALARAIVGKTVARQRSPEPENPSAGNPGEIDVKSIARIVARILRERGVP